MVIAPPRAAYQRLAQSEKRKGGFCGFCGIAGSGAVLTGAAHDPLWDAPIRDKNCPHGSFKNAVACFDVKGRSITCEIGWPFTHFNITR